jgi:hypothetical protein
MDKISESTAYRLMRKYHVNPKVIPFSDWYYGLLVELEHGTAGNYNITNDDPDLTAMIALAHIDEFPDYYKRLKRMEKAADKYWEKRRKPGYLI